MQLLFLFPAFIIFLFYLYQLVKDDYLFIRKNILSEQMFDIAFLTLWGSLFVARLWSLLFYPLARENIFLTFFSFNKGGFSLLGGFIGGVLALYFIGKWKKMPLGRLFDFFTLAFLVALPWGFLSLAIVLKKSELLFIIASAILFFGIMLFFLKYLLPRLMNRTLREGTITAVFSLCFSIFLFASSLFVGSKFTVMLLNTQSVSSFMLILLSSAFLSKQLHIIKKR
jgi:prolipoprotein diacylglyceryltransferase